MFSITRAAKISARLWDELASQSNDITQLRQELIEEQEKLLRRMAKIKHLSSEEINKITKVVVLRDYIEQAVRECTRLSDSLGKFHNLAKGRKESK